MDAQRPAPQRLLEAGERLFAEKGFKGASVREIARLAGLAPNMINHHFGGKQALYDAVLEKFSKNAFAVPTRILADPAASATEFRVKFELFMAETLQAFIDHRQVFQILTKHEGKFIPLTEFRAGVIAFLSQAKTDGLLRPAVDVAMVLGLVLDRLGNQVLYAAQLAEDAKENVVTNPDYRARWLKANADILVAGIAA